MSEIKWNSGPPPHIGWWRVDTRSLSKDQVWRWWDGKHWSCVAFPDMRSDWAAHWAGCKSWTATDIKWCDYWPPGARVPRIDPRSGK